MTFGFITGRHLANTSLGAENTQKEQVA
jgi:hypothetical protein